MISRKCIVEFEQLELDSLGNVVTKKQIKYDAELVKVLNASKACVWDGSSMQVVKLSSVKLVGEEGSNE